MRKTLFEGKFLRLLDEDSWEFADRPASAGVVSVVAVDGEKLLLVEQFRHAQQAAVVSFPGGLIDRAEAGRRQETAIEAGRRELREETGYEAGKIEELVSGPISPGMTTEAVTFVLAQDLAWAGAQMLDANENIALHQVPLLHLSDWLGEQSARGWQIDLKVFVGLYFLGSRDVFRR
jgi:ADP-ribose pyrophosphatase